MKNLLIRKVLSGLAIITLFSASAQIIDTTEGLDSLIDSDGVFYFQIVPSNSNGGTIDAFFTLSQGPISAYPDGSMFLRFNTGNGYLDVYDDAGYTKTATIGINFGATYHCWFDIDFDTKTYDTYVQTGAASSPTLLHSNAKFRKKDISLISRYSAVHVPFGGNELIVNNTGFVDAVGSLADDWLVKSTSYGELGEGSISNIPINTQAGAFLDGLNFPGSATAEILNTQNESVNTSDIITSDMKLKISGIQDFSYTLKVREIGSESKVTSAFNASLDHANKRISKLYNDLSFIQFKTGIQVSPYASFRVIEIHPLTKDTVEIADNSTLITSTQKVEVTAENGSQSYYSIATGSTSMPVRVISNSTSTYNTVSLEKLELEGSIEWHIKAKTNPLPGSILNLKSEEIWIYFDQIKPQDFYDNYLSQIQINGQSAEVGNNVRLTQFSNGCVLISHPGNFKPLTVYADVDFAGASMELGLHTYYKTTELGALADNIESFKLKKGYMASFSENINGTGNSQVFIADKEDIIMSTMPSGLNNNISFVRVFPWRWTNKKGYDGSPSWGDEAADASWTYSHGGNGHNSTLNVEFVPIRHNPNWPSYSEIQAKENSTHALFYNEPNNEVDDGFSSVEDAIAQYPNLLASGLRMVSPAPTDGGAWWIYDFLEQCEANNYRVDAVAIHFYRGCQSTKNFYDFLKAIHDNTGKPIWVTEWANGCNWTNCNPTSYEENKEIISDWVEMLEAAPFVERYVMWHGCTQYQQFYNADGRTPAGQFYHDYESNLAYSTSSNHSLNPFPANGANEIEPKIELSWSKTPNIEGQMLYFGETYPPKFMANLEPSKESYQLQKLEYGKTYYWRIDEFKGDSIARGEELEFNTIKFIQPYNPYPAIGSKDVTPGSVTLTWTSDSLKTEVHHLYFGPDQDSLELEVVLLDQLTSYEMTDLIGLKEYFWRVDEHLTLKDGTAIVTEGVLWNFKTGVVTAIQDSEKPNLQVYPIPVTTHLQIKGIGNEEEVEIFNILGAKVLSQKYQHGLDVSHLPKGIYMIRIDGFKPIKVVK